MKSSDDLGMPLRVGTFNGQFLPHMVSCASRARALAENIVADGYDLISLNEVFSNRARRVLVKKLTPHFPYNVTLLRGRRKLQLDSGLMLFSKLPLGNLSDIGDFIPARIEASGNNECSGSAFVRFDEFVDHCCSDGLASKGAAYARATTAGQPLHVFWTHVQASYLNHSIPRYLKTVRVRAAQMRQMAAFIRSVVGAESLARENVLILGDFNVHWSSTGAGYAHDGARLHGDEWEMMFEAFGPLFQGNLVDVWQRYAPSEDPGPTYPAARPTTRPDYILLSAADPKLPLCVQHVSVAHSLAENRADTDNRAQLLSDHRGLCADLNLRAPHCNLSDAHDVSLDGHEVRVDGQIRHPGGVQWYRFSTPGTYRIRVGDTPPNGRIRTELYSQSDISRPLASAAMSSGDATAREYRVVSPSYVRVGDPRQSKPGDYTLYFSKVAAA